jgi:hypothetical protein
MTNMTIAPRVRRLMLLALVALAAACDYSTEVKKSVQRVLRQDFKSYHFFATPAGNFGVGTMYLKSAQSLNPSTVGDEALVALTDTYFAREVPPAERDEILKHLIANGTIGKFSIDEKITRGMALDLAVPGIGTVLNGSGTLDLKKGVEVELYAGETTVRKLVWTELARARRDRKIADDIAAHLDARDVIIAMNDVVIRGYTALVKLNASANVGLKAELDKAAQGGPVKLPSGSTTFSSGQDGTYRIEVSDPVVVAVLFKEIPIGAQATADSAAWPTVTVPADVISRLQQIAARRRSAVK